MQPCTTVKQIAIYDFLAMAEKTNFNQDVSSRMTAAITPDVTV